LKDLTNHMKSLSLMGEAEIYIRRLVTENVDADRGLLTRSQFAAFRRIAKIKKQLAASNRRKIIVLMNYLPSDERQSMIDQLPECETKDIMIRVHEQLTSRAK